MIFHAFVFLALIFYVIYVFVVSEPCARIERTTKPVYLLGVVVETIAEPWASPATLEKVRDQTFKLQLRSALLVRKQFYHDAKEPVVCQWDAYAHLVGGQRIDLAEYNKQKKQAELQRALQEAQQNSENQDQP
jgi:hypothetical protein